MRLLTGRLDDIARGHTGLPVETVLAYRNKFADMGYVLPELDLAPQSLSHRPAQGRRDEGPGKELKNLIDSLHITASGGCACEALRLEMDYLGIQGCQREREQLIEKLRDNSTRVSWLTKLKAIGPAVTSGLAFSINPLDPLPGLFDEAVRRAQIKAEEHAASPVPVVRKKACGSCGGGRAGSSPWKVTPGTPRFITTAQLMEDTKALASKLPADTVEIVGIARSGVCVATMVSMLLHRPLNIFRQSSGDLIEGGNGWRLTGGIGPGIGKGTTVVIDDTCMTGNSFKHVMPIIRSQRSQVMSAAVYVNPSAKVKPDLWAVELPWPHLLEWNVFNSVLSPSMAVDFDGILCHDCPPGDDDDGARYLNFLENARPLYLARKVTLPMIVTARLEKYRPQTMAWLERHGVTVKSLIMGPWSDDAERARADVAAYKAQHFTQFVRRHRGIKPPLFVESDRRQAERIAQISKGLVVCPAAGRCFT